METRLKVDMAARRMTSALEGLFGRWSGHPRQSDRWHWMGWCGLYVALGVAMAWSRGQDLNWDLLAYHFYSPYRYLHGGLAHDVWIADAATFLNPLLDFPLYFAIDGGIPPTVFFLSLAAFHGTALVLVHAIARLLLPEGSRSNGLVLVAVFTAATGAAFRAEIGNTMNDNTLAVLVLAALALVLRASGRPDARRGLFWAGVWGGAAMGAKWTIGPACLGLAAAVITIPGTAWARTARLVHLFLGGVAGLLATSGWWMWELQRHFQSPLFPYFNEIFQSPWAPLENFSDRRVRADGWTGPVTALGRLLVSERVHDGRLLVGALAVAAVIVLSVFGRKGRRRAENSLVPLQAVSAFWLVAYVLWIELFAIYRYAVFLELLAGALLVAIVARLLTSARARMVLAAPVALGLAVLANPGDWGRRPWSPSYFGVDASQLVGYQNATLVVCGSPIGYAIPSFPASARFVRLSSSWGLTPETAMWRRAVAMVEEAPPERLFVLQRRALGEWATDSLPTHYPSLRIREEGCRQVSSYHGRFRVCPLERTGPIVGP